MGGGKFQGYLISDVPIETDQGRFVLFHSLKSVRTKKFKKIVSFRMARVETRSEIYGHF